MMPDIENRHGLADILTDPNRTCARGALTAGECVCDGSSYMPVLRPKSDSCGYRPDLTGKLHPTVYPDPLARRSVLRTDDVPFGETGDNNKLSKLIHKIKSLGAPQIRSKYLDDRVVAACNDVPASGRFDALNGNFCNSSEDCPEGTVCSGIGGQCVPPSELRGPWDIVQSMPDYLRQNTWDTSKPIQPMSAMSKITQAKQLDWNKRRNLLQNMKTDMQNGLRSLLRSGTASPGASSTMPLWIVAIIIVMAIAFVLFFSMRLLR